MNTHSIRHALLAPLSCAALLLVAACGGGDDPVAPPSANQPPAVTITSPAEGATYRAGERIAIAASATDREDGLVPGSRISWWVTLHRGSDVFPAAPITTGASGGYDVPVRGETSAGVFYRVHVRATDSTGRMSEVTRDVQPRTADVTLATQPPGLQLTLDGQPVTGPHSFTGVQGVQRDIGAATQVVNGRRYTFASWSDGGAAVHVLTTPNANTTVTATFTDGGPAGNLPPVVTLSAATSGVVGTPVSLVASAADADGTIARVQFYDGAVLIGERTAAPYSLAWTPTTAGVHNITARATDDAGDATTSAPVAVTVIENTPSDNQPPTLTLTSPAQNGPAVSGTVTVSATATDNVGVVAVEFQVDGTQLAEDTAAPWEASWNTTGLTPGPHVVRARARDAAGNLSPWASVTVQVAGGSTDVPPGFTRQENWISGLSNATAFVQAPDGRFFIAEQGGRVRVARANGQLLGVPFINLSVDDRGERGLIGITLHPNFPTQAWVYVHYTRGQGRPANRVSRYAALGDVALGLEDRLLDLPPLSDATNHNGGAIHFGADGRLYIAVGDNADPARAADLDQLFGKILRLNADGSIPNDNPYYDSARGNARAIWASGLRNPYTFAVQPGTGRIYINDVGEDSWEEINLGTPGANYGWPSTEGPTSAPGITAPLYAYPHTGAPGTFSGQSIAGGAFYPTSGGTFPTSYRGNYFFADYVGRQVARLDPNAGNAAYAFATLTDNPVDMLVGQDGALYVLTRSGVTRIAPAP